MHKVFNRLGPRRTYLQQPYKCQFKSMSTHPGLAQPLLLSHEGIHLNDLRLQKKNKLVIFVHGILGNKRNWRTPMKHLSTLRPDTALMAVDLRGHGDSSVSQHGDGNGIDYDRATNTVETCAEDLRALLSNFHAEGIIQKDTSITLIAHSFGGKVALKYLEQCDRLLTVDDGGGLAPVPVDTWIVDSIPGAHLSNLTHYLGQSGADVNPSTHADCARGTTNAQVEKVLKCLHKMPPIFESRDWAIDVLRSEEYSCQLPQALALWLGTSIMDVRLPNGQRRSRFKFRVEQLIDLYNDYCTVDMHGFLGRYGSAEGGRPNSQSAAAGGGGSISDLINTISETGDAGRPAPLRSRVHFLRAGKNKSWDTAAPLAPGHTAASYLQSIISDHTTSPQLLNFHVMPHVDHWVHAEDVKGFTELVHRNSL